MRRVVGSEPYWELPVDHVVVPTGGVDVHHACACGRVHVIYCVGPVEQIETVDCLEHWCPNVDYETVLVTAATLLTLRDSR